MSVFHGAEVWIALSIGNTHCRWGYGVGDQITQTWITSHSPDCGPSLGSDWATWLTQSPALAAYAQHDCDPFPVLWLASVVPTQTMRWQTYPRLHPLSIEAVPIGHVYFGLGVDRALALWAAGTHQGWPVLVIDAGTALTFSGADAQAQFKGGAILPGLGLQFRSLAAATALPLAPIPPHPPHRWARDTQTALQSGIFYGTLACIIHFIETWLQQFPNSALVFTGGDAQQLVKGIQSESSEATAPWVKQMVWEPELIFKGMALIRRENLSTQTPSTHCQTQPQ
ncbi:pantothenate kinase [Synechococcales cyanobacterium C]|uniref:Type III pantothenate kinase n=1 Tax=Petrachloros mirabilis ULC683 TaxID=2781853 RepID=A0A8K2A2P0_9CYAN|nr:pantothenate kinase [Petrachloros mirabilis]NCJ08726.1 pantothenate kinase [Petrachloros mirabilis ULC683]